MSNHKIDCCFDGCDEGVWIDAGQGTDVAISSATCLSCRRVVFCLEHFLSLYRGSRRFPCPLCDAAEWWVCLFEGDSLYGMTPAELQAAGAIIEQRDGSSLLSDPPPPESGDKLQVVLRSQLPKGCRPIGRGLAFKLAATESEVWFNGQLRPVACEKALKSGSASPTGRRLAFAVEDGSPPLICYDGAHGPIAVHAPPGTRLAAPCFVDEVRFVYTRQSDLQAELWEAVFDAPGRVRSRRVADLGMVASGPSRLAASGRSAIVTVRTAGSTTELIRVSLATAAIEVLAQLNGPPRQLVACDGAMTVAWIDWHGEVRYIADSSTPQLVGRTADALLALSRNGDRIGWLNGDRVEIVDLAAGRFSHQPASPDAFHLRWLT